MENQKAQSAKAMRALLALLLVGLLVMSGGVYLMGYNSGRADGEATAAPRLPASPQLAPEPLVASGPNEKSHTLTGVFLFGNQIAGTTNFKPSDIVSGDCRLTEKGQSEESMTLIQELGNPTERNSALLEAYAFGSVIELTNTHFVPGDNPHIVSDARIVPQGVTAPFPAYLEVTQAKFKWALPGVESPDGSFGDPLIVCNYS
jgi:hypothetical protein